MARRKLTNYEYVKQELDNEFPVSNETYKERDINYVIHWAGKKRPLSSDEKFSLMQYMSSTRNIAV